MSQYYDSLQSTTNCTPYYKVLYSSVLFCTTPYYSVLFCPSPYNKVLQSTKCQTDSDMQITTAQTQMKKTKGQASSLRHERLATKRYYSSNKQILPHFVAVQHQQRTEHCPSDNVSHKNIHQKLRAAPKR